MAYCKCCGCEYPDYYISCEGCELGYCKREELLKGKCKGSSLKIGFNPLLRGED